MNWNFRNIIAIMLLVVALLCLMYMIVLRVKDPSMTDMQFLLEFGELHVFTILTGLTGTFLLEET